MSTTTTITRTTAVAELRAAGYEGPVSYGMPKLRGIYFDFFKSTELEPVTAEELETAVVADLAEVTETPRERKNRLARERRAAKQTEAIAA